MSSDEVVEEKAPYLLLAGDVWFECTGISVQVIVSGTIALTTAAALDPDGSPLFALTTYERFDSDAALLEDMEYIQRRAHQAISEALINESLVMVENKDIEKEVNEDD